MARKIELYDTTLRDGAQAEDISFSLEDKLLIARKLAELGIDVIEGGYPAANPRDAEFFRQARKLKLGGAALAAFGSTHKPGAKPAKDKALLALVDAGAPVITIFGKTWDFHAVNALKVTPAANLDIIHDTIVFLKKHAERVCFDAEHFFDGCLNYTEGDAEYAFKCLKAAEEAGADCLVLCDTNGGTLPKKVAEITKKAAKAFKTPIGIHAHNDSDCAVASSLAAIEAGAVQVQGTINGLGERCGNANLCSIIPNLELKMGCACVGKDRLALLRDVSRYVNEIANITHFRRQPFVGDSAFAHKAGMHVSAIVKSSRTYEHIPPAVVGNSQRILVSDLAGKSNIIRKAHEFGIDLDPSSSKVQEIVGQLKELEGQGFQFEGAEASFELLMKKALGLHKKCFALTGFRVFISKRSEHDRKTLHEATVMLKTPDGKTQHVVAVGNGPVNALDTALRKALVDYYPALRNVSLLDYKVRVLDTGTGTGATVRVLIESGDGNMKWSTVGVSEDVVEASYQALLDSIEYKLLKDEESAG